MQLLGTFWPLVTPPLVLLAAILAPRRYRWWVLFVTPVLLMLPCVATAGKIVANGNLLFAVIFGMTVIAWIAYYLVLAIVCLMLLVGKASSNPEELRKPAE